MLATPSPDAGSPSCHRLYPTEVYFPFLLVLPCRWPDNWQAQDPNFVTTWIQSHMNATKPLNKPLVMEEFGKNSTNPFDYKSPDEPKRRQIFSTVFGKLQDSLKSGDILRAASYWMFDPSIQSTSSDGYQDYGQDQVPVDSPTFTQIIVPAARAAATISEQVQGCKSGTTPAPAGRRMLMR